MKHQNCNQHHWVNFSDECAECSQVEGSGASPCSSITLNFRGDPSKPHDICRSDYEKLSKAGFLFEFYPDAPAFFPTNNRDNQPGEMDT